ncbi:hypothetical protein BD324DRAFT_633405 [Kockovaella imperatae]|uniref:Uncharacterized protein n=1 Tax=Kockovaella imperatae TaxID=4999 RepID=A0A1Y1UAA9_9TREE|nr:hypothetical protein BD324DRAFT_633405 [Kockovaella imperatae]ORX34968.1 hypothetical protein BD324DRAFT_633405 [Kockovaella imperatae]
MRRGLSSLYNLSSQRFTSTSTKVTSLRTSRMAYPSTSSSPSEILSILPDKFESARMSGELFYFPSTAKNVQSSGRRFNICCSPALLNKEKAKADILASVASESSPDHKRQRIEKQNNDGGADQSSGHKSLQNPTEPFKPPYSPDLYVGHLEGIDGEPGMSILLNKYAVLRDHILLCPTSYEPQNLPPSPSQLALAYLFLLAASRHTKPRRMMGFYNGGPVAGASQKWRHIQLIEVPDGRAPVEDWVQSMRFESDDEPLILPHVPYLHIVHSLSKLRHLPFSLSANDLEQVVEILAPALMRCLDLVFQALRVGKVEGETGWNLLLTLDHLHLIPRTKADYQLSAPHTTHVDLNACAYAGLFLVRSEEEDQTLLQAVEPQGGLDVVLRHCGVSREHGEQAIEAMNAHKGMLEDMQQLAR